MLMNSSTVVFLISQICSIITYKPIIETLVGMIFLPHIKKEWKEFVDEFPINVPRYSYNWLEVPAHSDFTLSECNLCYTIDILYNYNDNLDLLWDNSNVAFMRSEWEYYRHAKEESKTADFEDKCKEMVMEKLGKEQQSVEVEHRRLSRAFGYPIGLVKTLKKDCAHSVLNIRNEFDILEDDKLGLNPYFEFIHEVINVFYLLINREQTSTC
eukprot:TRINITY_DN10443_c0_g2_i2.p1 TRINITY_DN10443_c0_g2~~TRINITY_DN10443_c0_g2_i2.p1  ORF type:complete len:212 (-),score=49.76 TRINITY_DN10443_c0_g2_i2:1075-1710(-)